VWVLRRRLRGAVRGRDGTGVFGGWGLCVSGRKRRKRKGEPSLESVRTAIDPISVRTEGKRGSRGGAKVGAGERG